VLILFNHDRLSVARFALEAGANGVVLKSSIADDLFPAIDAAVEDRSFVSPGIA
jgi:DNA-binding NarL/FixJ family response regulator